MQESLGNAELEKLEKEVFDLRQLLEISKSLSSNLDYATLLDSILYICMGQFGLTQAAIFSRDNLEIPGLKLIRNLEGFELDPGKKYIIDTDSPLIRFLVDQEKAFSLQELKRELNDEHSMEVLNTLKPSLVVPLVSKSEVMGLLVLGNRIHGGNYTQGERRYLMDIAHFASNAIHNAVLFEMSTTDMMTKLKLKHFFFPILSKRMSQSREQGSPLSLIMADIDHFKNINDTYGHQAGDEVLKAVGYIIRTNLRQNDIGVRYGGEEFVILLQGADEQKAFEIAERLRNKIGRCDHHSVGCLEKVTISMGVAQYDTALDNSPHDLISRVDRALYLSKQNGRNRSSKASSLEEKTDHPSE